MPVPQNSTERIPVTTVTAAEATLISLPSPLFHTRVASIIAILISLPIWPYSFTHESRSPSSGPRTSRLSSSRPWCAPESEHVGCRCPKVGCILCFTVFISSLPSPTPVSAAVSLSEKLLVRATADPIRWLGCSAPARSTWRWAKNCHGVKQNVRVHNIILHPIPLSRCDPRERSSGLEATMEMRGVCERETRE